MRGRPGRGAKGARMGQGGTDGSTGAFARGLFGSRECVRAMCAVALANLSMLLMNRSLFPLFDAVFIYARDISITCAALLCIAVGLVSLVRPALLRGRALTVGAAVALLVGAALMAGALALGSPALLAAGACLFVSARSWAMLCANLAAVGLPVPQALAVVSCGVAGGQLLDALARTAASQQACVALMAAASLASLLLVARPVEQLVGLIASAEPMADVAVTRPETYLPLTHSLYLCLIVVQTAFGFALRFGEVGGAPSFGSLAAPFALAVAVLAVALRGRLFVDQLANVVMLALVAGFLVVAVQPQWLPGGYAFLANGALTVGTALFGVLLYGVLVALAGRNRLASLSIMGWGVGLSGLATVFGALLGTGANALVDAGGSDALALLAGLGVLLVAAYVLFGMRGFSFARAIEGVAAPSVTAAWPAVPGPAGGAAPAGWASGAALASPDMRELAEGEFAARCHELAARHGLTPREEETFAMLARGRDRAYIEERLRVSRNTVKAHVKHVYAKLGIHSHQELLDLVEDPAPQPARG